MGMHIMFITMIISLIITTAWFFKWDRINEPFVANGSTLLSIIKLFSRKTQKILLIILFGLMTVIVIIFYVTFILYG
ncbi:putative membrane protein [Kurthia sp. 11kri321]|nr:putative membrane protein [Kurthia sp. 11kri321]